MKLVLSTTVLASVVAPAVSFSYLDSLGGGAAVVPAAAAPANGASYLDALGSAPVAAAPEPAAPAAPVEAYVPAAVAEVATGGNYFDNLNVGEEIRGPGLMTHTDTLNTGTGLMGGAGIESYTGGLPTSSALSGGAGIGTHVDTLSPSTGAAGDFNPFGSSASASFSGSASADGVAFTLETGDISGLVQDLSAGGTLRLSGTIDNISYN